MEMAPDLYDYDSSSSDAEPDYGYEEVAPKRRISNDDRRASRTDSTTLGHCEEEEASPPKRTSAQQAPGSSRRGTTGTTNTRRSSGGIGGRRASGGNGGGTRRSTGGGVANRRASRKKSVDGWNEDNKDRRRKIMKTFKNLNSFDSVDLLDEQPPESPKPRRRRAFEKTFDRHPRRAFGQAADTHGRTGVSKGALDAMDTSRQQLESIQMELDKSAHFRNESTELMDVEEEIEVFTLGEPIHDDEHRIGHLRNQCGAFVNSVPIQWLITILIITNGLVLGALTFVRDNDSAREKLEKVDLTMLCAFTFELALQVIYLGPKCVKTGWLLFDGFIVIFSWAFLGSPISVLRSFRIFRVFALMSRWGDMRRLIAAVARTIPNMTVVAVALMLFMYVFCVLYTDLYYDLYEEGVTDQDYFGRLDKTFLTLFQFMTLDSWSEVTRQIMVEYPYAWIGVMIFVTITAFFILNLVVAVICESLIELNSMEDEQQKRRMMKQQRNLIAHQTEQLLMETHEVVLLQRQMLFNQLAMQNVLVEMAQQLGERRSAPALPQPLPTPEAPPGAVRRVERRGSMQRKAAMQEVISSMNDSVDCSGAAPEPPRPPRRTERRGSMARKAALTAVISSMHDSMDFGGLSDSFANDSD